ncbi:hypothetical protein MKW94_007049 [Papaver nudicaule]|uniref:Bet v I/Major latex protein domain-containing protein n=1 Tax=Papaver nudicaule TaxID=74823 RepID=A0AA41V7E7_PAPNU|nr:hypothetical protein [Papaver nudicaule]
MRYEFINEFEVDASADDVWAIYTAPNFPALAAQLLVYSKARILWKVMAAALVLFSVLCSSQVRSVVPMYKEKIVTVDHEKKLKEIQMMEGGYLEMGCTFCMLSFEILAKERISCIIKTVTKYEISDDLTTGVSAHFHTTFDTWVALGQEVSKHIAKKNATANS